MTRWSSASSAILLALSACSSAELAEPSADATGQSSTALAEAGTGDGDGEAGDSEATGEDPPIPDLGGRAVPICDPWAQDCPAGEKCSWEQVEGLARTHCVPIEPNPKPPGEPCSVFGDPGSGYDDCALGAICGHVDADNQGLCVGLCGGSPAEPTCVEALAVCQVCPDCPSLCQSICDPLADACPDGFVCTPDAGSLTCLPNDGLGTGTVGDPCEYTFQCAAGHACVDATKLTTCEGAGCCSPFCDLTDPSCPDALICTPWFPVDAAPLPDLGVCGSA